MPWTDWDEQQRLIRIKDDQATIAKMVKQHDLGSAEHNLLERLFNRLSVLAVRRPAPRRKEMTAEVLYDNWVRSVPDDRQMSNWKNLQSKTVWETFAQHINEWWNAS